MATVDEFSRLVFGIYAAAVTPEDWHAALDDVRRAIGGTVGTLSQATDGVWAIRATTAPADVGDAYADHYYRLDYVLAGAATGPVGAVRTGTELIAPQTDTEFYNDWMRPNDIGDGLFARLTSGRRLSCLIVASPARTEPFDTPERVKLMGGLVQHLQQALRTQNTLEALSDRAVETAGALESVRHGVVVLARDGLVVNYNSAAERIFRTRDGLMTRSGRLAGNAAHFDRELSLAIDNALTGTHSTIRTGSSLTCPRPSGKRPYVIHVSPSHRRNADEPLRRPMALALIIDPEDEPEPDHRLLQRLYHLTRAEADIAIRVLHGAGLKEISEQLSISLPTVRTHLQHIFDKTDTHRQAELVRLLLALSP
ncbi:DNA-binding protein with HTH domain [Mycolicibacterium chubuense NBB4]|uniref:DNA-binding protein with HTH domain n=1 Tax=Mycolicibacterium chubuense (strain NBB4) TaxID=710421 RepID=I4BJY6_MYCCN|nr:LuxR C-terminal-related transcriptional regulator [Mycolicibacterium chubuense]AFM17593.1 DNA-binding protein with HTH domain [Mycolicibacterium chubuense NBB4]